jgi:hypothetical protein
VNDGIISEISNGGLLSNPTLPAIHNRLPVSINAIYFCGLKATFKELSFE